MSTGTFVVSQSLNYRGGARVEPADSSGTEKAFEPATGNGPGRGRGRSCPPPLAGATAGEPGYGRARGAHTCAHPEPRRRHAEGAADSWSAGLRGGARVVSGPKGSSEPDAEVSPSGRLDCQLRAVLSPEVHGCF